MNWTSARPSELAAGTAADLGPEVRAVLATVREDDESLREALRDVRWKALLRLAMRERATTVLNRCVTRVLQGSARPEIEPGALDALERRARIQELRLLALDTRLTRLLAAFREHDVEVVLLKGAAFQRAIHDSPLDRPTGDLDLLVNAAAAERAWEVARSIGWDWDAATYTREQYRDHHHLPPLVAAPGLRLEIHTGIFPPGHPFRLDAGAMRRAATPLPDQPGVLVPSAGHLLLHAVLHFAWSHTFEFGVWKTFRDVNTLVERGALDWDRFIALAKQAGGAPAAFWTLRLASGWAGVRVPASALTALAPPVSAFALRTLDRHFAWLLAVPADAPPAVAPARSVWLRHRLWELAMGSDATESGTRPWSAGAHDPRAGERPATRASARGGRPLRKLKNAVGAAGYLLRLIRRPQAGRNH